jgi:hypothetical protein
MMSSPCEPMSALRCACSEDAICILHCASEACARPWGGDEAAGLFEAFKFDSSAHALQCSEERKR